MTHVTSLDVWVLLCNVNVNYTKFSPYIILIFVSGYINCRSEVTDIVLTNSFNVVYKIFLRFFLQCLYMPNIRSKMYELMC